MSLLLAIALAFGQTSPDPEAWRALLKAGKDAEAVTQVQASAATGDPEALDFLGWFYDTGRGLPKDLAKAAQIYRQAAEAGHKHAQWRYGVMLDMGEGVEADPAAAIGWFEKAAAQKFRNGFISLGVMHSKGRGVPQDHAKALSYYMEAARMHAVSAFAEIAIVHAMGEGVPKNPTEAMAWAIVGASYDSEKAKFWVQKLGEDMDQAALDRAAARATEIIKELKLPTS